MNVIMDLFLVYFGNWQVIAMIVCLYYLMLKSFKNKLYFSLWNSIKFDVKWIPLSFATIITIFLREILLYPLQDIQSWMPDSFLWEQMIMWLYTTHIVSIALYSIFLYYFWRKFDSFLPAMILGFFSIGIIEFTFIIQHLVKWRMFLGFNWYSAFGIIMIPFIVEYKRFFIRNWKRMVLFLGLAFTNQYAILPLTDYSLTVFDSEVMAYRINYDLLPHPHLITWIFMFLQTSMKILFLLGLSNIDQREVS